MMRAQESSSEIVKKRMAMIIDRLVRGRKRATQLQKMLKGAWVAGDTSNGSPPPPSSPSSSSSSSSPPPPPPLSAGELAVEILRSFTETLSDLGSAASDRDLAPASHDPSKKRLSSSAALKDRRGCHKGRKSCQTLTTKISSTFEDAHAWRKYGQKVILNAKHPRSYYRCTHKYDRDCKATKHVQKTEENPQMFLITYIGVHTCSGTTTSSSAIPQMIITAADSNSLESFIASCSDDDMMNNNNSVLIKQEQYFCPPFVIADAAPAMEEGEEEQLKDDTKNHLTDHANNISNNVSSGMDLQDFDIFEDLLRSTPLAVDDGFGGCDAGFGHFDESVDFAAN